MHKTQTRLIAVAVVVSGFAVGMAGLLNYFKYRSTANRIVTERLVVTGKSVENSVQQALELGLQFGDLGTLPAILDRERTTDDLIQGIDVFDSDGKMLYSTDRMRSSRPVPAAWMGAARKANGQDWMVEDESESAAGMSLKNTFGITLGHLALRYSSDRMREAGMAVARELAVNALGMFVLSSVLSSLALLYVMRSLNRDVANAEAALRAGDGQRSTAANDAIASGPFGAALRRFIQTTRGAEREIAEIGARLQRGANP